MNQLLIHYNINLDRVHRFFFYCFLFLLPFSTRKVLWFLPIRGNFNEYADISIFASDIAVTLCFVFFIIAKHNKIRELSIKLLALNFKYKNKNERIILLYSPLILALWALFTLTYASQFRIGIASIIKIFEFIGVFYYVIFNFVSRETSNNCAQKIFLSKLYLIIILSGIVQSLIAISQFIARKSVGLRLLGESVFDTTQAGVAKIIIDHTTFVRAYGTFPHPNVLASFLVFSLLLIIVGSYSEEGRFWKNSLLFYALIFLQFTALVMTFSKAAVGGFFIALVYIKYVSRETRPAEDNALLQIKSKFWIRKFVIYFLIVLLVSMFIYLLYMIDYEGIIKKSSNERYIYTQIALSIIQKHIIMGISCGQMVYFMQSQEIYPLFDWQFQPVHNVLLLVWVELGIVGFVVFSNFIVLGLLNKTTNKYSINNTYLKNSQYFKALLIAQIPMLLLDHYIWDLQQGAGFFWIMCGIFVGSSLKNKNHA